MWRVIKNPPKIFFFKNQNICRLQPPFLKPFDLFFSYKQDKQKDTYEFLNYLKQNLMTLSELSTLLQNILPEIEPNLNQNGKAFSSMKI